MQKRSLSPQLTAQWHIEKAEIKNVFNTFAALLTADCYKTIITISSRLY